MVYARESLGDTLTFIVSGKLWRNGLVMQDRETETLWSQPIGEAMEGPLMGRLLEPLPSVQTTWSEWNSAHPESDVLRKKEEVTHSVYQRYFDDSDRMGIFPIHWDADRLPAKILVHGLRHWPHTLAITEDTLSAGYPLHASLGEHPIVAFRGSDGGVRAFSTRVGSRSLTFEATEREGPIRDQETGSSWDLTRGYCTAGPCAGAELTEEVVRTAFWFAWSAFYPETDVISGQ